jgi:hypothetical protein
VGQPKLLWHCVWGATALRQKRCFGGCWQLRSRRESAHTWGHQILESRGGWAACRSRSTVRTRSTVRHGGHGIGRWWRQCGGTILLRRPGPLASKASASCGCQGSVVSACTQLPGVFRSVLLVRKGSSRSYASAAGVSVGCPARQWPCMLAWNGTASCVQCLIGGAAPLDVPFPPCNGC